MELSMELQNGLVWTSRIIQSHLGACSGHAAVHRPLIVDGYGRDGGVQGMLVVFPCAG